MPDNVGVIATNYRIDASRPGPILQGGMRVFTVVDGRDPSQHLIAIETRPDLPVRPRIALARSTPSVPGVLFPIEYGLGRDPAGKPGWFGICQGLPGSPLRVGPQPWREGDLLAKVLQPAASALAALQSRGLTHRAINPANLFRAGSRDSVTLGPFWTAPPGSLQPALFEAPDMACCLPTGRGEGTVADDVYSLGVTLLCLAIGRVPLEGLSDADILRRKIELGSFAALTADAPLQPMLADLLRGMLAEDPDHRPSPALLQKPEQARARRVAARPPRRAQQPLSLGGVAVWTARELALGLSLHADHGYVLLKSGEVERWLRRCLGDPQLGMRIEEVTRRAEDVRRDDVRGQSLTVMRCVAALDPLAPLVWRGVAIQPDGLGTALVGASAELSASLQELVSAEAVTHFAAANERKPQAATREEPREWRLWLEARGPSGGLKRLTYALNPMLPCASPLLAGAPVVRAADLLPALDAAAARADRSRPPIDAHVAAFLAARADTSLSSELTQLTSFAGPADRLAILRLFGRLQGRLHPGPLPNLAGWLVAAGFAALDDWQSRKVRAELEKRVAEAAGQGNISTMLELVDDEPGRLEDRVGAAAANVRVGQLTAALGAIAEDAPRRAEAAVQMGHEMVAGVALIGSLGAIFALALQ